jgi:hypothetical protein
MLFVHLHWFFFSYEALRRTSFILETNPPLKQNILNTETNQTYISFGSPDPDQPPDQSDSELGISMDSCKNFISLT